MLDKTQNEPSKFRKRNWVEVNDESRGMFKVSNQIKFKTSMIRSDLCDYSDTYILASGTITITGAGADDAAKQADERNEGLIFKNCAPFIDCISEINNTQVDNAKDIDAVITQVDNAKDIDDVIPMDNLIEYRDNYLKTSGSL